MKRYKFSQCADAPVVDYSLGEPIIPEKVENNENEVFNMIYAPDPLTGRPRSDLGTYLSENTSPVVRDFIERQLRQDFSGNTSTIPDGISDSDILYLTKDKNETVSDYQERVKAYMLRQKDSFQKIKSAEINAKKRFSKSKVESKIE